MKRLFSLVLLTLLATALMASDGSSVRGSRSAKYRGTYQPVYDIAIEVGGEVSVVRWYPPTSYFPAAWNAGSEIAVYPGRHSFVLQREGGEEVRVPVISREASGTWHSRPHLAPTDVLPPGFGQAPQ